jgi:hypothetical protein
MAATASQSSLSLAGKVQVCCRWFSAFVVGWDQTERLHMLCCAALHLSLLWHAVLSQLVTNSKPSCVDVIKTMTGAATTTAASCSIEEERFFPFVEQRARMPLLFSEQHGVLGDNLVVCEAAMAGLAATGAVGSDSRLLDAVIVSESAAILNSSVTMCACRTCIHTSSKLQQCSAGISTPAELLLNRLPLLRISRLTAAAAAAAVEATVPLYA